MCTSLIIFDMLVDQLAARRGQIRRTMQELASLTGMAASNLSRALSGRGAPREDTLEALAQALDSEWVLVPREHLPEVKRILEGKPVGPDRTPSTAEILFGEKRDA